MPGVIFLEHFNCNHLFLKCWCLLINCVRDNNQGVIKNVNGACARQPVISYERVLFAMLKL